MPAPIPTDPPALPARLAGVLEAALDAIVTIDHAGRFLDFNPAAERAFGYTRAEVVGREMTELILAPRHRADIARVFAGEESKRLGQRIEITAVRADGSEFPVEFALTRLRGEGPPVFAAYLRDLSEREQADADRLALQRRLEQRTLDLENMRLALEATTASRRESQVYFEKSFNSNPSFMSIARAADGKIIEANPAFLRTSGFTREEVIGRTTVDLGVWLRPVQRDEFIGSIRAAGSIRDFEADFRGKTGTVFTLLLNADLIELGGEPCMLTVGIDITERRRRSQTQTATYEISQAALAGDDLPALLAKVHRIIANLMPARNLYVALLNADRSLLSFPYFVDETMEHPIPRAPRNGVTEFVLDTGEPLLALDSEVVAKLKARGDYVPSGQPCAQWMGAPLKVDGRGIGVIALQDYHNPRAYAEEDKRLLVFVAEQTAAAIHRQQVETAQREARAYFEKSFHASSALMSISRVADGRTLEINPAFLRSSGYARDEIVGRTTTELGVWQQPAQRDEFLERFRAEGTIRDFAVNFRSKGGRIHTLLLNSDLIELAGEPCMLTVGIDITDRRRRDQMQAATFEISQLVVGSGDLPALFAEVHRIIASLMPAQNLYVGLLSDDGTQLSFPYFVDELVPPQAPRALRNGFTEYVIRLARPVLIAGSELPELLRSQGPYQPLERPAAQRLGAPLMLAGHAIGVIALQDYKNANAYGTEELDLLSFVAEQTAATVQRRRAEAARARAEENYRSIFENAIEGLYLSTVDGRFLRINPAFARMCGYAEPATMIAGLNDIGRQLYVDPNRRGEFFRLIQTRDSIADFESEIYRADGSTFWIAESVRVVRAVSGAIDHFEGVALDITQRREAARILQAAKDAADTASRAKSRFLASVSHELRTPLNGILGYTQILRRDSALGDKQREGVRVIHESADHLLALINDLLDLSKIEAGRLELQLADFDLTAFALGAARIFAPRAREKNLVLETELAPELPHFVRGDEQRLRQVIFNLLANAVKFTAQGGVVFSILPVSVPDAPRVAGTPASLSLRFSISDTGPGIAPENIERIFEPFTQVGDLARNVTGTGLGLAISRSLVEHFGGKLHVESRVGWGSRFWFDVALPVAQRGNAPISSNLSRRVRGYEGPRRRVLVVDDNPVNRSVIIDLLAPVGFELAEAADGASALMQATAFRPELVLMDLRLSGGVDGFEATRQLRARPEAAGMRIVAISASAFQLDRTECFVAGCDAFLAKPFREEELWSILERALDLVWKYSETEASRQPFPQIVQAPPPGEAAALYELASKGDVVGIRARAHALLASNPELAPFAQNLLDLSARFKMKAIRQFVGRYVAPSPPSS